MWAVSYPNPSGSLKGLDSPARDWREGVRQKSCTATGWSENSDGFATSKILLFAVAAGVCLSKAATDLTPLELGMRADTVWTLGPVFFLLLKHVLRYSSIVHHSCKNGGINPEKPYRKSPQGSQTYCISTEK